MLKIYLKVKINKIEARFSWHKLRWGFPQYIFRPFRGHLSGKDKEMYTFCILFYFYLICLNKTRVAYRNPVQKCNIIEWLTIFFLHFIAVFIFPDIVFRHFSVLFIFDVLSVFWSLIVFFFLRSELAFNIGAFLKSKLSHQELNP